MADLRNAFFLLIVLFSLLLTTVLRAEEVYSERPNILDVKPKPHPELAGQFRINWRQLKEAKLEATAQLLELYPDREIYFLGRDAEYLYDLAKLMTRDEPAAAIRLHLINVSRTNLNHALLPQYLAQEGISKATLKAGKKILLVDTGFSGTISNAIAQHFPEPELAGSPATSNLFE